MMYRPLQQFKLTGFHGGAGEAIPAAPLPSSKTRRTQYAALGGGMGLSIGRPPQNDTCMPIQKGPERGALRYSKQQFEMQSESFSRDWPSHVLFWGMLGLPLLLFRVINAHNAGGIAPAIWQKEREHSGMRQSFFSSYFLKPGRMLSAMLGRHRTFGVCTKEFLLEEIEAFQ